MRKYQNELHNPIENEQISTVEAFEAVIKDQKAKPMVQLIIKHVILLLCTNASTLWLVLKHTMHAIFST